MYKNLLFIFNPTSGKAQIKEVLCDIIDLLVKHNYTVTAYPTQSKNDAYQKMITCGENYDQILCSGGDGTLNEIVRACIHLPYNKAIAYIPTGTTNDFATTLHLPKQPLACLKQILKGKAISCDAGTLNQSYFVYIAAFGLFSDVSYTTPQTTKNILGHSAYVLEGMKQFMNIKKYHLRISYHGFIIEDEFCYGMITNSMSVGGFHFFEGTSVDLSDGQFECLFIKYPNNPLDYQQTLHALISKEINSSNRIYCFKAKELSIESLDEKIAWTIDGEFGGKHQEVHISNIQNAFTILK